jgi:hypothetical protein
MSRWPPWPAHSPRCRPNQKPPSRTRTPTPARVTPPPSARWYGELRSGGTLTTRAAMSGEPHKLPTRFSHREQFSPSRVRTESARVVVAPSSGRALSARAAHSSCRDEHLFSKGQITHMNEIHLFHEKVESRAFSLREWNGIVAAKGRQTRNSPSLCRRLETL